VRRQEGGDFITPRLNFGFKLRRICPSVMAAQQSENRVNCVPGNNKGPLWAKKNIVSFFLGGGSSKISHGIGGLLI